MNKIRAFLVGLFILIAYGVLANLFTDSKTIICLADVISGTAVIGIAVLIYPLFKLAEQKLSLIYLGLKVLEGSSMILGGVFFLSSSLAPLRGFIYENVHLYIFIVSAGLFYYLLQKAKLIPRFIAIWGLVAIFFLAIKSLLSSLGLNFLLLDLSLLLIITNEVFLAGWLMIRGFNKTVLTC